MRRVIAIEHIVNFTSGNGLKMSGSLLYKSRITQSPLQATKYIATKKDANFNLINRSAATEKGRMAFVATSAIGAYLVHNLFFKLV